MLDGDRRRLAFSLLGRQHAPARKRRAFLQRLGVQIPARRRNDLIVEDAPLSNFEPMAEYPARSFDSSGIDAVRFAGTDREYLSPDKPNQPRHLDLVLRRA